MTAVGQAFAMVFEPYTLMVMVLASLYGLFVGAVPGLTATMAIALLVPVTFFMAPIPAIAAIVTATAMAIFSGDIPGCLLRIPGTPASAAYTDEAFAMTKKGEAETALGAGLVFSAVGGLFGTLVLIVAAPALAEFATRFSSFEYFWLVLLGLGWWLRLRRPGYAQVLQGGAVAVLYLTLGFRQFSHHFTDIRDALEAGDEEQARRLLAEWRQTDIGELPRREIVRQVIEQSVLSAHRHVFGVLAWFSILAAFGLGPAGAVFYRLAEFVARYWPYVSQRQGQPVSEAACAAARQAWHWVDWLPARITALGFAVVGSFEDAIDSWRSHEAKLDASNDGVILAATAGAVNVRLGEPAPVVGLEESVALTAPLRQEPELAHLRSIVGLVWRSVVMWMLLLALLTLARLLG